MYVEKTLWFIVCLRSAAQSVYLKIKLSIIDKCLSDVGVELLRECIQNYCSVTHKLGETGANIIKEIHRYTHVVQSN